MLLVTMEGVLTVGPMHRPFEYERYYSYFGYMLLGTSGRCSLHISVFLPCTSCKFIKRNLKIQPIKHLEGTEEKRSEIYFAKKHYVRSFSRDKLDFSISLKWHGQLYTTSDYIFKGLQTLRRCAFTEYFFPLSYPLKFKPIIVKRVKINKLCFENVQLMTTSTIPNFEV